MHSAISNVRLTSTQAVRCAQIVWKNSQNDRSRKSQFLAPNLICAGNRHDEVHGRATRRKSPRAADPLPNFPSRSSMAVKNRVFPHNRRKPAVRAPKQQLGSDAPQFQTDARRNVTECDPRHSAFRVMCLGFEANPSLGVDFAKRSATTNKCIKEE